MQAAFWREDSGPRTAMEKMARVTTALGGNTLTGRTMFCHLDAPANAISVCRDAAQVVVAGRNIFKIYSIEEEQFVEKLNLRVGRKPSLNFSCADVVWHQMDENLLATAATNGVVVTWNLGKPSRNKQDQLFTEHKRTVNKVCFHPTEVYMLLSGSQDGYMKCFDLRKKDSVSTFSGMRTWLLLSCGEAEFGSFVLSLLVPLLFREAGLGGFALPLAPEEGLLRV